MPMQMIQLHRKRHTYDKWSKLYIWFNTPNNSNRRLERGLKDNKKLLSKSAVESK